MFKRFIYTMLLKIVNKVTCILFCNLQVVYTRTVDGYVNFKINYVIIINNWRVTHKGKYAKAKCLFHISLL